MSLRTIFLLIRMDVLIRYRTVITVTSTVGLLIIMRLVLGPGSPNIHLAGYQSLLFVGGLIITSRSFSDMYSRIRGHAWMMLPASVPEKLISRLLQVTLLWILFSWVGFIAFSVVGEGVRRLFGRSGSDLLPLFSVKLLRTMAHYIIINALFLLGATYFRRLHLIKTILFFVVVLVLLTIVVGVRYSFQADFLSGALFFGGEFQQEGPPIVPESVRVIITIYRVLYWSLLAPFCWFVSYLRLREYQLSNAV